MKVALYLEEPKRHFSGEERRLSNGECAERNAIALGLEKPEHLDEGLRAARRPGGPAMRRRATISYPRGNALLGDVGPATAQVNYRPDHQRAHRTLAREGRVVV